MQIKSIVRKSISNMRKHVGTNKYNKTASMRNRMPPIFSTSRQKYFREAHRMRRQIGWPLLQMGAVGAAHRGAGGGERYVGRDAVVAPSPFQSPQPATNPPPLAPLLLIVTCNISPWSLVVGRENANKLIIVEKEGSRHSSHIFRCPSPCTKKFVVFLPTNFQKRVFKQVETVIQVWFFDNARDFFCLLGGQKYFF